MQCVGTPHPKLLPMPKATTNLTGENSPKKRSFMRLLLFVIGGAVVGYLYYRFVGCRSGACPISSNPFISTGYGALMGFIMGRA